MPAPSAQAQGKAGDKIHYTQASIFTPALRLVEAEDAFAERQALRRPQPLCVGRTGVDFEESKLPAFDGL